MQTFNLSGKQYTMPNALSELNYADFVKLSQADSDLGKLQALLHADLSGLDGTETVAKQMAGIITRLDVFSLQISEFLKCRDTADNATVDVLGKKLKFDKDLGKLPYWALTKVKALIKQMGNEPFNEYHQYTRLVANYVYSQFKPYNEYEAEQFGVDVIDKLPFTDVIRLGDFFLYMQHRSWLPKQSYSKLKFQQRKNRLTSMFSLSTVS